MLWLATFPVSAGTKPSIDLSLALEVSPRVFVPGGRNTVEVTVHNGGPSAAGTIPGNTPSILLVQDSFIVTTSPPAFEVIPPIDGCWVERLDLGPFPDGSFRLAFVYYFSAIPSGQSRTCTFDVLFDSSTLTSLPIGLTAYSINDTELNVANNRLDYTFIAAYVARDPVPAPVLSIAGLLALVAALVLAAGLHRWRGRSQG